MKISKNILIKPLSLLIIFTFFFTNIAWPETPNYTPFNEDQNQSQFLTQDQLDEFTNIKQALIDTRNETNPKLATEPEIIEHLYNIIVPEDLASLTSLETLYNQSVASREEAQNTYADLLFLLTSYYEEVERAKTSLDNVYNQIDSVSGRISSLTSEKSEAADFKSSLENNVSTKTTEGQVYSDESTQIENDLNPMYVTLSNLSTNKGTLKSDLNAAEAALTSKTDQKQTLENEITSLLAEANSTSSDLAAAEAALLQEETELSDAIDLVHLTIASDYDIYTSTYDKIFDGEGNLIGVTLPPEHDTGGVPTIEEKETILFNALIEDEEVQDATALVATKQALKDAAQASYDNKLTEYNTFLPEYNQAVADYQLALASFNDIKAVVSAFESEIQAKETDLLASYEKVKLVETDISTLNDGILSATNQIDTLSDLIAEFDTSLGILNVRRTELEALQGIAQQTAAKFEDGPELAAALMELNLSIDQERTLKSLYDQALEERSEILGSLQIIDNETKSELITSILSDLRDQDLGSYQNPENLSAADIEFVNNKLLGVYDNVVLVDGQVSLEALLQDKQIIRKSLRENYIKVFQKEPTSGMLDAFVDMTQRVKIPALRLFEVLKRIEQEKLKINEEEKLDSEKDLIREDAIGEETLQENQSIIQGIAERLTQDSFSSDVINSAINFLTSIPSSLITCGAIALNNLFNSSGKNVSKSNIAEEAILADIAENNLNQNTEAGLQLSLFALQNAAKASGTELYGQRLTENNLGSISSPFIAHVNDNHYVMVKSVMNDTVTIFDPTPNQETTTSLNEFMEGFTGNALTQDETNDGALLSETEMKNIYGAGWFSRARKAVRRTVRRVTRTVKKAVSRVKSSVKKAVSKVKSSVKKAVSKVKSSVKKTVSRVKSTYSKAKSKVKSTYNKAKNKAKSAYNKAKTVVTNTYNKAVTTAKTAYTKAANFVNTCVTNVKAANESAKSWTSTKVENFKTSLSTIKTAYAAYKTYKTEQAKQEQAAKEAEEKAKQEASGENGDKSAWDKLVDFFTITPGVEATSESEDNVCEVMLGDGLQEMQTGNSPDLQVCSMDNEEYMSYLNTLEPTLGGGNLTENNIQTVIVINEDGTITEQTTVYLPSTDKNSQEGKQNLAADNSNGNNQNYITVINRQNDTVSYLPIETQETPTNNNEIISITSKGTAFGLLFGTEYFEQALKELGGTFDPDLGSVVPKDPWIPRDASGNAIPLPQAADGTPIPSSPYPQTQTGGRLSTTRANQHEIYKQVREWKLDKDGKLVVDYELDYSNHNRPWDHTNPHKHVPSQPDPNKPGYDRGKHQPAKPGEQVHAKNGAKSADDGVDNGLASSTANSVDDGIDDGIRSATVNSVDNSLDDGINAGVKSAAKSAVKSAPSTTARILRTAVPILMVIGAVMDAKDLYDAHQQDKIDGGHRNLTATSGRVAGTWAGAAVGAKVGAAAGAAIGAFFFGAGAAPGAVIGGIIGGIIGGVTGAVTGEYAGEKAYDVVTEKSPAPPVPFNPLNPLSNLFPHTQTVETF